jgi:hypothetical protein
MCTFWFRGRLRVGSIVSTNSTFFPC